MTDAGLAHIGGLLKLTELNLADTKVTDAGFTHLQACRTLAHVNARGTKVTVKGLADFHAAVPGCRIEHDGGVIEAKN